MSLKYYVAAVLTILAFYHLRCARAAPFEAAHDLSEDSFAAADREIQGLSDESFSEEQDEGEGRTFHHIAHFLKKPAKLASNIAHGIGDLLYKEPYEIPYLVVAPAQDTHYEHYSHY